MSGSLLNVARKDRPGHPGRVVGRSWIQRVSPVSRSPLDPLVVDVKRCSSEDGPGMRSVVFFKGCPLRCSFCQNPEAQQTHVEIAFASSRCRGFHLCVDVCPEGAIDLASSGHIARDRCTRCGACVDACPTGALQRIGTAYSAEQLAEVLLRDRRYYERSGGGVTLSGGEPTMFPDYVEALLSILKAEGVHVILETGGHFNYELFREKILPHVDCIYFSLKIADPEAHRRQTGRSNQVIIGNLRRLMTEPDVQVEAKIPLIPGITDSRDNLEALVGILRDAGVKSATLLPYNPLGVHMAQSLGRPRPASSEHFMTAEQLERASRIFKELVEQV